MRTASPRTGGRSVMEWGCQSQGQAVVHYRSLDGLRGIAVLLVVLFHYGYCFPGWVGVQLFFVLSGFLITRGLVDTRHLDAGAYFGRFYWRRTLRIFPLNYLAIGVAAVAYLGWQVPGRFDTSWAWLVTYTTNFLRMTTADVSDCFIHFWSLAVEEQFYLVWPAVVYWVAPRHFRSLVISLVVLGPVLRAVLASWLGRWGYSDVLLGLAIYVNPLSSLDAFAMGALLVVCPGWGEWIRRRTLAGFLLLAAAVGITHVVVMHRQGGVFWPAFGHDMYLMRNHAYVWGYTWINLVCGVAVAYCIVSPESKPILEHAWLRYLGRISYGIYVIHFPLLVLKNHWFGETPGLLDLRHAGLFAVYAAATLGLATASYFWFEAPILKWKDRGSRSSTLQVRVPAAGASRIDST